MNKKIHFIGVGGAGISALARLSQSLGYKVSGCDQKDSNTLQALKADGFNLEVGHSPKHLDKSINKIVVSSAIPWDNPEIAEARSLGLPVLKRDSFCGELMQGKCGIGVAGTHGKTTTTSLISHLLVSAGLDPTFIVGGVLKNYQTNARLGQSDYFVIEADEYDRMFLGLRPKVAVITHLEMDHPDCYQDFADYKKAYLDYASLVPENEGLLIGCGDNINVCEIFSQLKTASKTYGFAPSDDFRVRIIKRENQEVIFNLKNPKINFNEDFQIQIPGIHNALNASAAIIVGLHLGIPLDEIKKACSSFLGAGRRFDIVGITNNIMVVDDYAHHPTAVKTTIEATKAFGRRLLVVYQPHQFARQAKLLKDYAGVFNEADFVFLTQIYASRDKDTTCVNGRDLFNLVQKDLPDTAYYFADHTELVDEVAKKAQPGDLILSMCVGNGQSLTKKIFEKLKKND